MHCHLAPTIVIFSCIPYRSMLQIHLIVGGNVDLGGDGSLHLHGCNIFIIRFILNRLLVGSSILSTRLLVSDASTVSTMKTKSVFQIVNSEDLIAIF